MTLKWLPKRTPKEPLFDEQGLPIIKPEPVKKKNKISSSYHSFFTDNNKKKNPYLLAICIFIIGGYFFFFISNFFFPGKTNFTQTELFAPIQFSSDTLKIMRWEYSPETNVMEFEIDSSKQSFVELENYTFSARMGATYDKQNMPVDIVFSNPDFVVLQIKNVPNNFGQMNVTVGLKSNEGAASTSTIIYVNQDTISIVEGFDDKYLIKRQYAIIEDYNQQIVTLNEKNEELNRQITVINNKNEQLEKDKAYQTLEQIQQTEQAISSNQSQIQSITSNINKNNEEITELNNRIAKANELIAVYEAT